MTRSASRLVTALGLAAAVACASSGSAPASLTTSEALVAGCQDVGKVSVGDATPVNEVHADLATAAQRKGGNYVLVASDGARAGTAYRCAAAGVGTR